MVSTLALIPARGGSKGIPRKNIRHIAGKPLIAWTIEAARDAAGIDRVVVSTDDAEIAEVAIAWGADVPFLRPAELASDDAPGIAPVLHAIGELPGYSRLLLLQPTSPLRDARCIEAMLHFATEQGCDKIVSVCRPEHSPFWCYSVEEQQRLTPLFDTVVARRQDQPEVVSLNGAMYLSDCAAIIADRRLVGPDTRGFVMTAEQSVDIDTMLDWRLAEMLLNEKRSS
jgi:CMP-N,N'-diacetyllegionaminic acid synthase